MNDTNNVLVKKYDMDHKTEWDQFVEESKNGTFMLKRDYMDYHSDRFEDYSLLFYENQKLIAVFPASNHGEEIRSHGGLTYGGIVYNRKMTAQKTMQIMEALISYYKQNNKKAIVYKRIPYIYYDYPSDEDLYALFRSNAVLTSRSISSSILMEDKIRFSERRRRNIKKAFKNNLTFKRTDEFISYYEILSEVLESRHNVKPVHTPDEMEYLASLFPDNIKLYATYEGDMMLAGVIIYETPLVAHAQYIASSPKGRDCGALDYCFDILINEVYSDKEYFDFGISNESHGLLLNTGLIEQKQEFGARGVAYDEYTINIV